MNTPTVVNPAGAPLLAPRALVSRTRHALLALGLTCCAVAPVAAQTVPLGTAASFSVLGGSAVTNTGPTVINGNLGISPNGISSVTGFPPGVVIGTTHFADEVALSAQNAVTTAYNTLAGRACNTTISADLGGTTRTPGVYCAAGSMGLTGTLTLDAQGNPDAVFIFQIGTTLTTASASRVNVINGGSSCNVFWQVGSSATLGTGSALAGNILALQSITVTTGAGTSGRLLARNGAVTLDSNLVGACGAGAVVVPVPKGPANFASNHTVPTLSFWGLLVLIGLVLPVAALTLRRPG